MSVDKDGHYIRGSMGCRLGMMCVCRGTICHNWTAGELDKPSGTEDAMPSMVPAQQLAELEDEIVRLAAAKDAEIAALTDALAALLGERGNLRDRTAKLFDQRSQLRAEIAALTEQRDRAMKVVDALRRHGDDATGSLEIEQAMWTALDAFDAEAAAETAAETEGN